MTSIATDAPRLEAAQPTERKMKADWLRDVILGGQDDLVNILGIVLGVIASSGSRSVLLGAGFAAAVGLAIGNLFQATS